VGHRTGLNEMEKRKFLTLPALKLRPLNCPARMLIYIVKLTISSFSLCEEVSGKQTSTLHGYKVTVYFNT
jgi:hypothetical protein